MAVWHPGGAVDMPTPTPTARRTPPPISASPASDLLPRLLSALVMMPLVLAATWYGGWPFALGVVLFGIGIHREWCAITGTGTGPAEHAGAALLIALAGALAYFGATAGAALCVALLVVAAFGLALAGATGRAWQVAGLACAVLFVIALLALRGHDRLGFLAVSWVFAIVWTGDVFAYFVGRAVGGPRLAPRISPKKTWSGALGGLVSAMAAGAAFAWLAGFSGLPALLLVSASMSIAGQAGDLAESALKRHFGVKDSGRIIPGHGGLMDRVDALSAAAILLMAIGIARSGFTAPARGALLW